MATIITTRKLQPGDFANWKARFEEGAAARKNAGCRGVRRFHSVDDPNEVIVIMDWDSLENGRKFIEGNMQVLRERNPGVPLNMNNIYVEELESLES
jgi:heme-degrading monooxygenase HmoA